MTDPTATKLTVRGCNIGLMRGGAGRPLLILHGGSGAGRWLPFMAELAARHDVIVPEHPGFGSSDTPDWLDNIPDLANFYLDFLDQLDLDERRSGRLLARRLDRGRACGAQHAAARLADPGRSRRHPCAKASQQVDTFLRNDEQRIRDLFHDPKRADADAAPSMRRPGARGHRRSRTAPPPQS